MNKDMTEFQQVAALVCMDIDMLSDIAKKCNSLESLKRHITRLKESKDKYTKDADYRKKQYNTLNLLFSIPAKNQT